MHTYPNRLLQQSLLPTVAMAGLLALAAPVTAQRTTADEQILIQIHQAVLDAHVEGNLDRWMSVESPSYVSVNGGRISSPTIEERRERRARYVGNAEYSIYRDLREPVVRISDDGSLGWLAAEVEVKGTIPGEDGQIEAFHDIWAWIELYEKTDDGWRVVGNASNRRDPE